MRKTRLGQILNRYLDGREIAVWGTPTRLLLRELEPYPYHIADHADCERHYVIAVTDEDLTDFLLDGQSRPFRDVEDYICYSDKGKELPFEWEYFGTKIGRQTYFGEGVANACEEGYIASIGRYTSVNSTAVVHVNHQSNMIFVSDELPKNFTDENKALFQKRYLADPKHPYASGKAPLTIGNDVWIGAYSFINCSRVTNIGDGAIIGAGAVVLEDVPPYAVVAGVPAKIKRYRFAPDLIETLLRVRWWDWSEEEINANAEALLSPELFAARFGPVS